MASVLCDIALIALVVFTLHGWYWIIGIAASVIATKIRYVSKGLVQLRSDIQKEYEKAREEEDKQAAEEEPEPAAPATIPVIVAAEPTVELAVDAPLPPHDYSTVEGSSK